MTRSQIESRLGARLTQSEARSRYTRGNNEGLGYAPYTDDAGDDTIEEAVAAAQRDGWELILARETSEDVAVLRDADGGLMAIGGDAMGNGAWAVDIGGEVQS
jgi:hypothetical protein